MTEALANFRVGRQTEKPEWALKPLAPRWSGTILAVDQTLGASGWAYIEPDGTVYDTGTVRGHTDLTGHAGTLDKGTLLFAGFLGLLEVYKPSLVVHETPPVSKPGNKMMRPESSLVAANSLRNAAHHYGVPVKMIGSQKAKHRFTGQRDADKKQVRAALVSLDPRLATHKPMNEHIADGIALGWVALEEKP